MVIPNEDTTFYGLSHGQAALINKMLSSLSGKNQRAVQSWSLLL